MNHARIIESARGVHLVRRNFPAAFETLAAERVRVAVGALQTKEEALRIRYDYWPAPTRKSGNRWRSFPAQDRGRAPRGTRPGSPVAVGTTRDLRGGGCRLAQRGRMPACVHGATLCGNGIMTETGHLPRNGRGPVRDKAVARLRNRRPCRTATGNTRQLRFSAPA